ncbi:MAG: hypothetical protein U9R25_02765 [Chloroflexota bacterium]|nr:hypothetical protein [Chloroflexota bacterium]
MSSSQPLALVAGVILIVVGLAYPMVALIRVNKMLGQEQVSRGKITATLLLTGVFPLTAVLAGFYLLSEQARQSAIFSGALIASALFTVAILIYRSRVDRSARPMPPESNGRDSENS